MSEFTQQLRQPSGYASLDDERSRAADEIDRLTRELESARAELDESAQDSGRHLALLIQERQRTEQLTRERDEAIAIIERLQADLEFEKIKSRYLEHDADCCGGCTTCLQNWNALKDAEAARHA